MTYRFAPLLLLLVIGAAALAAAPDDPPREIDRPWSQERRSDAARAVCHPKAGSCLEAHPGPGCAWPDCCDIVCDFEPECCETTWDEFCAVIATKLCPGPPPPCVRDFGNCFHANSTPGCHIESCCQTVCMLDPYCCTYGWDGPCAALASELCGRTSCVLALSATGATIEADECEEPLNDGCNDPDAPAFTSLAPDEHVIGSSFAHFRRDTDWYELSLVEPQTLEWEIVSEFPMELAVMVGSCDDGFAATQITWIAECTPTTFTLDAAAGQTYLVIAPGSPEGSIYRGIYCRDDEPEFPPRFGRRYSLRPR